MPTDLDPDPAHPHRVAEPVPQRQLQQAKNRLSEVVKAAGPWEPELLMVHGQPAAGVVSPKDDHSPHRPVMAWLGTQPEPHLWVSTMRLIELHKDTITLAGRDGTGKASPSRAAQLRFRLERLRQGAEAVSAGPPNAPLDGLIMATAQSRGLGLLTRNIGDFVRCPHVFNPWPESRA